MLVVDLHTLHAVHILDFVDDVFLHGGRPHDVEDVGGGDCAVRQRCASTDVIVLLHEHLLGQGHEIFLLLAELGGHADFTVTTLDAAEGHLTVDFRHDGGVARVTGLEQLGHTGQTTGDVTGARGGAGNLDEHLTGLDVRAFLKHEVGVDREGVGLEDVAILVDNAGLGNACTVFRLDDDFLADVRLLVGLDAVGDILDQVLILDLSSDFADDNGVEGVPFADDITLLDFGAVAEVELRTVRNLGGGQHQAGLRVDDAHFSQTTDDDLDGTSVHIHFIGGHGAEFLDFKDTVVT